jgi:exosortase
MEAGAPPTHEKENGILAEFSNFFAWCGRNPGPALLLAAIAGTLVYFFGFIRLFVNGSETAAQWAWLGWNAESEQDYCAVVPPISLFLLWYHRDKLRAAPKSGSNKGLIFVAIGVLLFVLSARCLQPRMALMAVSFLLFGSAFYLWGPHVARIILFPCAFLFFMVPVGALEQNTARLQGMVTGLVGFVGNIAGLNIQTVGTTIMAADGRFTFQVAEGCSGIRSITALTMLTAIYVHLMETVLWKKITTFLASFIFAIVGNAGRIFTIIVVARLINVDLAGGKYHHVSGFISFPFALLAMIGFSKLLNIDWKQLTTPQPPVQPAAEPKSAAPKDAKYDY